MSNGEGKWKTKKKYTRMIDSWKSSYIELFQKGEHI